LEYGCRNSRKADKDIAAVLIAEGLAKPFQGKTANIQAENRGHELLDDFGEWLEASRRKLNLPPKG
jgi:hypothetical protein